MNIEKEIENRIRESIGALSARLGVHYERELKKNNKPPNELSDALSEAGFVGIGVPEEYGGGGLGLWGLSIVCEELARNGHLPVMLVMSPGIVGSIIAGSGTDNQKKQFLPGIAEGVLKFSFAITEAGSGSNTHAIETKLKPRESGGFTLHGEKCFISGVEQATHILVVAKAPHPAASQNGLVACIADRDAPGISLQRMNTEQFSSDSQWIVTFDNVLISEESIVGQGSSGLSALFLGLNPERVLMASFCNGLGLRSIDLAVGYARSREVWGTPIGAHQAVSHPLAKATINVELARMATEQAARAETSGRLANYAKYAAAEAAIAAIDHAIEVHGGNGFTEDYGISELYWPARLLRTAPVSAEMILNFVAHNVLGLPKGY